MKNVILSIAIFLIMVITMSFSISYLHKISLELENLNNEVEQYIANEKWDMAYKTYTQFKDEWEHHTKIIKLFVNHQEIDNIEMELCKLSEYVKEKTKDEALASISTLDFLLSHVSDLEKINLQNIF